ncbi:MAG TPA: ABC transporter permease [Conexibacter sp.]|nr:ABC transporter permease [Conexibacter sp.]
MEGRAGRPPGRFAPRRPLGRRTTAALAGLGLVGAVAVWAVLTYGKLVEPFFLPTPSATASTWWRLVAHEGYLGDIWASVRRVLGGFTLAAALAVPLGLAMGSIRAVQALVEPLLAAIRYMPATAFIPLLIIWLGLGETEKLAVIFIGAFFPLTLMVAEVTGNVRRDYLQIAATLGASSWQQHRLVVLPAAAPGILANLRIAMGWAWTYLIIAELVAADTGIGYRIVAASRFLQTDVILAGVITIGVLGLLTDACFRLLAWALFRHRQDTR